MENPFIYMLTASLYVSQTKLQYFVQKLYNYEKRAA